MNICSRCIDIHPNKEIALTYSKDLLKFGNEQIILMKSMSVVDAARIRAIDIFI